MIADVRRRIFAVACALAFMALFLLDLFAVVANGYAAASIAAFSKDLERSYTELTDLFDKMGAADGALQLAQYDAVQEKSSQRLREQEVAKAKVKESNASFTSMA